MKRRALQLPPVYQQCALDADTLDTEQRVVTATFLSGQPIARVPLFSDAYFLEFDVTEKAADFSRLNAGASVLDSHRGGDLAAVLGKVERAWIEKGKARATLRFSRRPEVETIWQDIADGILGHVSMGVFLERLEELEPKKGDLEDMRRFAVRRWQPYEISIVGVPADAGARIEAAADERHPCRVTFSLGGESMRKPKRCPSCKAELKYEADEELTECGECGADLEAAPETKAALRAERDELRRCEQIRHLASAWSMGELFAQKHVSDGTDFAEVRRLAAAECAKREPQIDGRNPSAHMDYESPGFRLDQMAEGLAARAARTEPSPQGRRYYDASFVELAYELLKPYGYMRGLDVRRNASRIIELSHVTSDFPLLLANALHKRLLPQYELAQPSFKMISAVRQFADFRPHPQLRGGDFPLPLQVGEAGEITMGTMSESREQVSVLTFARIFGISRVALVNDDVGFFDQLAVAAARRVSDFHNMHFFSTCITFGSGLGPALSDGVAVYNSAHGNVGSAGALSVTLLGEGRAKMMSQTSLDGLKLNLLPRFLLVSPTSLTLAEQYTAQLSPQVASEVNPFGGRIIPLGDANISGTRFYLIADPAVLPQYVHGFLDGVPLRVETRQDFSTEGIQVKVVTDFAVGAIEHRAGVTAAGA